MAKKKKTLSIPVFFGNVNIGDETARLDVSILRGDMDLIDADVNLCGRRLTGTIVARLGNGQPGQDSLPGSDDDPTLSATFDVKSFSVKRKSIGAGLTFSLTGIDVETLARFAKRYGKLDVIEVADLPDDQQGEGHEES